MPTFYNTGLPTPSTKNNITSIAVTYGIRDFLLNKNLAPVYPQISTSINGSPKIGQPVLDTMVGTGNVTSPFGLPLETEGILRMQIAILPNQYKNTSSTANSLLNVDFIPTTIGSFPNSTAPSGINSYPDSIDQYGLESKTVEGGFRKNSTLLNLYLDTDKQVDAADWITLQPQGFSQQLKGYLDTYGGLNLGGSAGIQAANIIGSVLNGQGLGLAKGGIVTNFDVRSSLAGRVLGATGIINDTKLGMIGAQQLALALANNAAFNVEQAALGALNVQDNALSLVKNGTLAGFRPNYQITVPSGAVGRAVDYTARILGFTLPKSYLEAAGSIFLSESNSANIERANSMILNTGKGQVKALISNVFVNVNGTGQYDNPSTSPFRTGYVPEYKDNKGNKAINPSLYAFYNSDNGTIYNFLTNTKGVIPETNFNYSKMIIQYGFTGPEENIGAINPYAESTIRKPTFTWGSDVGGTVNSETSPFGGNIVDPFLAADKKKSLLAKTQLLFNDTGMKNIVSGFGDIDSSIVATQIQTAVVGGGISKGSAVMAASRFNDNGRYTGDLTTPANTYCRTWTTNFRYDSVTNLVRSSGLSEIVPYRVQTQNSSLDKYGFAKIAPYSTDSQKVGDPKNYMFSIENLAWADTRSNLLPSEIGPGDLLTGKRGRIMWFPPYNIQFSESSSVNWETNNFVGRGESVYTYNNTERSGNLSFQIVVDHPSYINSFRGEDGPDDHYVASFFAGCVDPSSKFADKLTVTEKSSIASQNITPPQQKTVTPELAPSNFTVYYPNDYANFQTTLSLGYESGLSGASPSDKIDYNVYTSGFGIGSFVGGVTSNAAWNDDHNNGLNGWKTALQVDGVTYSGVSDPGYFTALATYLDTKCPHCIVNVTSFASPQGDATANNTLANDRTQTVVDFLTKTLYSGKDATYKQARIKAQTNHALTASESGCIVGPSAATDTIACKTDRRTVVSFEFSNTLASADVAKAEPVVQQPQPQQSINSKIKNRLYNESNYFEQLTDIDTFIFDKFREKIKYFHPAFHSTTPEGLNSRLTFLQQCTRQGPTLEDQGANNLAFGRPPVCILRIGDFYNTKIIIDNISIDYEPLVWDLNPEGIGVQPMIANVNLSFKFIGGSTLMGPINKLQNALSFNYYANAHVYDPRADYIAKTDQTKNNTTTSTNDKGETEVNALSPYYLVNGVENINSLIERVVTQSQINANAPVTNQSAAADNANGPSTTPPPSTSPSQDDLSRIKFTSVKAHYFGTTSATIDLVFNISGTNPLSKDQSFRAYITDNKSVTDEIGIGKFATTDVGTTKTLNVGLPINDLVGGSTYAIQIKFGSVTQTQTFIYNP